MTGLPVGTPTVWDDESRTRPTAGPGRSTSLRETHVPYVEERGLVAYDPMRDQIADPEVELFLENDPQTTIAWYSVYLGVTAVATLLLALVRFDVPPFGDLAPITVAGLVVVAYAVASLGHWYDVRR